MVYWTIWRIWLVRWLGIPILMIVGYLSYLLGLHESVHPLAPLLIGFVAFVVYAILVVGHLEKKRKNRSH